MAIRMVAGLGNPGPDYASHRHNAGYWLVDQWAADLGERFGLEAKLHAETARLRCAGQDVRVIKPTTFMNRSGQAVTAALRYWKIEPEELLVVHDELDLPAGVARLKFDGGHGGQNGLRDTIAQLGHGRFHRLRIGIGHPGHKDRVTGWVLGRPSQEDSIAMRQAIGRALQVMPLLLEGAVAEAMKRLHTVGAVD